jgi:hypothetical protein
MLGMYPSTCLNVVSILLRVMPEILSTCLSPSVFVSAGPRVIKRSIFHGSALSYP